MILVDSEHGDVTPIASLLVLVKFTYDRTNDLPFYFRLYLWVIWVNLQDHDNVLNLMEV